VTLTANQVDEALVEWWLDQRNLARTGSSEDYAWENISYQPGVEILPIGYVTVVEDYNEEFHTDRYVVISIETPAGKQYFKRNGWRQSHYGSELDGPTVEVVPEQKTITIWNTKEGNE